MPEGQWFYARGGQQIGPVSFDTLRQMNASGQVSANDLVWREGMANWQPLGTVPEFAGVASAASPFPQSPGVYPPPSGTMAYPGYGIVPQSYNGMAVTAFVLSLLGLVCAGVILGIVSIALSVTAQNGMKRSGNFQGRGLATAALVLGIIDIISGAFIAYSWLGHLHRLGRF